MELVSVILVVAMLAVIVFVFRGAGGGKNRCNRCDGAGQVSERWPDPKEPTGWHVLEGTCPKCKGKGVF